MHIIPFSGARNLYWRPFAVEVRSLYLVVFLCSYSYCARPQVNEQSLSMDTLKGQDYRLDESLFERMMFPSEPGVSPLPTSRLNLQRRMHPDIADIMRATLYPFLQVCHVVPKTIFIADLAIQDHESTSRHPPVAGMVERLWWFDHTNPEDKPDPRSPMAKSYSNSFEVDMVIGLVTYLVETNEYSLKDIAILTPYNGQLAVFAKRLKTKCSIWLSDEDKENLIHEGLLESEDAIVGNKTDIDISTMLRLSSIDSFQGEEAKVIILSTVRSNPQNRIGFLKTNNRINVACSRAREGFYIIGNSKLMSRADMWQKIVTSLADKSKVGPEFRVCCSRHPERAFAVRAPGDWEKIPVCQVPCAVVLPCGHPCTEGCHPKALHSLSGGMACGLHVEGAEAEGEEGEEGEEEEGEGGKVEGEGEGEEEEEAGEEVGKVGREVEGEGAAVVVDYGRYLHEEAFLEQMLRMKEMWVKAKQ